MTEVRTSEAKVDFYHTSRRHIQEDEFSCLISDIRGEVHENCVFGFLILEDGSGKLSRNVGNILTLLAA